MNRLQKLTRRVARVASLDQRSKGKIRMVFTRPVLLHPGMTLVVLDGLGQQMESLRYSGETPKYVSGLLKLVSRGWEYTLVPEVCQMFERAPKPAPANIRYLKTRNPRKGRCGKTS